MLLVSVGIAVLAGCGSSHRSATVKQRPPGMRIYDPARHVAGEVTETDVIPSSVKTWRGEGATNITFELTAHGRRSFLRLTRGLAHRGAKLHRVQHFAIEIGGRVYSRPFIDYRLSPDGLEPTPGVEISNVPPKIAKRLANELRQARR